MMRRLASLSGLLLLPVFVTARSIQPAGAPPLPLDEIRPGMPGEVWTVFRGTEPEPFSVEVAGIVRSAFGPGRHLILCRLIDPKVKDIGPAAGMSGSPLYISGRLAGALSYQLQRFETVPHAGFTPVEDLLAVGRLAPAPAPGGAASIPSPPGEPEPVPDPGAPGPLAAQGAPTFVPLTPVFSLSGLDPAVVSLFAPRLQALGISAAGTGGSVSGAPAAAAPRLQAGGCVCAALAIGDITIAGTGTVARIDGDQVLAFGHPLMRLGAVEFPMAAAEVVTILPSQMSSTKVTNVGPVIGTITQDRLSAISGRLGPGPAMIPVNVDVRTRDGSRHLVFSVVRQPQLTPMIAALGLAQAILGSNDAGLAEGFRVHREIAFPGGRTVAADNVYAGPSGFTLGIGELLRDLGECLQNPFAKVWPARLSFRVEALDHSPLAILDNVQLSRTTAAPGETVQITLSWRDYRDARSFQTVDIPVDRRWAGKSLDVVVVNGPLLDEITGKPRLVPAAQIRSFEEYLSLLAAGRRTDGLYIAVVEPAHLLIDQTKPVLEWPASVERIARGADERRFERRDAMASLWEQHCLPERVITGGIRRPLRVTD